MFHTLSAGKTFYQHQQCQSDCTGILVSFCCWKRNEWTEKEVLLFHFYHFLFLTIMSPLWFYLVTSIWLFHEFLLNTNPKLWIKKTTISCHKLPFLWWPPPKKSHSPKTPVLKCPLSHYNLRVWHRSSRFLRLSIAAVQFLDIDCDLNLTTPFCYGQVLHLKKTSWQ